MCQANNITAHTAACVKAITAYTNYDYFSLNIATLHLKACVAGLAVKH